MYNNVFGYWNVAAGQQSLFSNTSGYGNSANGYQSLYGNTTGFNNSGLGSFSNVSSGTLSNATAIGYGASVNASNKVRLGNSSVTVVEGASYSTSDGRFKTNVKENAPGLDLIMQLKPVTYNFQYNKFSEFLKEHDPDKKFLTQRESVKEMGFIAQDVESACRELGIEVSNILHVPESENDNYSLAYQNLVVPLVKAVQEQQQIINEQKAVIDDLKRSMDDQFKSMQGRIDALMQAMNNKMASADKK